MLSLNIYLAILKSPCLEGYADNFSNDDTRVECRCREVALCHTGEYCMDDRVCTADFVNIEYFIAIYKIFHQIIGF